ncbi:MAG: DUF4249 domain-containing protein [Flavobacteriaceae bacterium]|nr:DUF4249 domain-containing protein [Flavobacteriaceae bacterium]
MKQEIKYIIGILLIALFAASCVEEIPLQTESFESVLVIEATITNETKQQEVLLSRSYMFDSIPVKETNATVKVTDDAMNTYTFTEAEPGIYKSQIAFAAQSNRNYNLSVVTSNGQEYGSSQMQLTQPTVIDNLYVERDFNENGIEGVSVYVDSYDPTGNSKYYRHEYEETYKIIAPFYSPFEMISNDVEFPILVEDQPTFQSIQEMVDFVVTTQLRPEQERICYKTIKSNEIITTNSVEFLEDRLDKYRVRFIGRNNTEIMHRYSILVRQYVQSLEAHTFYETLKTQSISESVFSETQPGFLQGNVFSVNDSNQKVIGFFEVSSFDAKRVFFNFVDLFPGEELPPYFITCDDFVEPAPIAVDMLSGIWNSSPLADAVKYRGYQYFDDQGELYPYRLVVNICGDCTFLGDNEEPDFWVD